MTGIDADGDGDGDVDMDGYDGDGGSPTYDGTAGALNTIAAFTGEATFGTPDSDGDTYIDTEDAFPSDFARA